MCAIKARLCCKVRMLAPFYRSTKPSKKESTLQPQRGNSPSTLLTIRDTARIQLIISAAKQFEIGMSASEVSALPGFIRVVRLSTC